MEEYQIEVYEEGDIFVARFKEMQLSARGKSKEEAIENLRLAFKREMELV